MRATLVTLLLSVSISAYSQTDYVGRLQKSTGSDGVVTIHQDTKITELLNSDASFAKLKENLKAETKKQTEKSQGTTTNKGVTGIAGQQKSDSLSLIGHGNGENNAVSAHTRRYKAEGFRVQIYAGNNSRKSRLEAERAGHRIKSYFPELPVYTHFYAPRWVCRVGDFRTSEEASDYLSQIRKLNVFSGVTLIKTTIQVAY